MEKTLATKPIQWCLILGGSKGLGLATARKLARHHYGIVIVHRDRRADMPVIEAEFEHIKMQAPGFLAFNSDATNAASRKEVILRLKELIGNNGVLKIVVHSIAKGSLKPMVDSDNNILTAEDINITFNAMALSLYEWVQAILAANMQHEDMRVISFTSEGNTKAMPGYGAVSVAKVALEALTRNMALEMATLGVKVNCIQAGVTETASFSMIPNSEKLMEHAMKRNPSGRLTKAEDVANVVYLLSTEEAKWITGTVLKADGGESLR